LGLAHIKPQRNGRCLEGTVWARIESRRSAQTGMLQQPPQIKNPNFEKHSVRSVAKPAGILTVWQDNNPGLQIGKRRPVTIRKRVVGQTLESAASVEICLSRLR
jgi:hypothetical protein